MNRSTRRRVLIIAAGAVVLTIAGYFLWFSDSGESPFGWKFPTDKFPIVAADGSRISFSRSDAHSDLRTPGGAPLGFPMRLKIPIIGVDSAVEDAVLTTDGKMDMPTGSVNVAWFSLGPPPGAAGSAVIGGHFGINGDVPFVFYNLDKLKNGDKIYIEDDTGYTFAFMVRSIALFDQDADASTVFTSEDGVAHLNLVTCEGIWNRVNGSYPLRRVVFADAIPSEGRIVVQALPTPNTTSTPKPTSTPIDSAPAQLEPTHVSALAAVSGGVICYLVYLGMRKWNRRANYGKLHARS